LLSFVPGRYTCRHDRKHDPAATGSEGRLRQDPLESRRRPGRHRPHRGKVQPRPAHEHGRVRIVIITHRVRIAADYVGLRTSMTTPLFVAITIETIGACNYSCWFCKYGQVRYKAERHNNRGDPRLMPWTTIERIVGNLADLGYDGRVSWYRINEPLLVKRLPEICTLTKLNVPLCHQTIITNGELLTQQVYDSLIANGLDHLTVSVYGDEVWDKVARLHMPNSNIKDRREPYCNWENRAGNISELVGAKVLSGSQGCQRPSTMMNVLPNGDVALCCADMYGEVIMGNVNRSRLEAIWYGEKFRRYRERLRTYGRQGLKLCEGCDHDGSGHGRHGNSVAESASSCDRSG
jgi:radical SAM protein with 4Fe4S-binding SPASM domain